MKDSQRAVAVVRFGEQRALVHSVFESARFEMVGDGLEPGSKNHGALCGYPAGLSKALHGSLGEASRIRATEMMKQERLEAVIGSESEKAIFVQWLGDQKIYPALVGERQFYARECDQQFKLGRVLDEGRQYDLLLEMQLTDLIVIRDGER